VSPVRYELNLYMLCRKKSVGIVRSRSEATEFSLVFRRK
jgi:hypothetical protein